MSTVTKGGRQLLKMIDKYDMKIVNEEQEICKGLWTREQRKDKSVIDYMITDKKYFTTIKGMHIDQNKEYATFKIQRKESGDIKKIYSDHNVIILKVDLMTEMQKEKIKKVITKGYKEYQQILQHKKISKIIQTGNFQINMFGHKLLKTPSRKLKRSPKKDIRKDVKELIRIQKELRKEFQAETNYYNKKQIIERIKMIKEHIIDKQKESRGNKIIKIADSIKRNVNNGSKIWEVKRRVTRKNTVKRQIKDSKGKILQDSEKIIKECEEYYKQLLTTRKPENTAETIAEE